jgi:hypothetical protein
MFKVLGVLVGLYTVYAAIRGEVFAKQGPWGRTISKQESPRQFWGVIVVYTLLTIALLTVF